MAVKKESCFGTSLSANQLCALRLVLGGAAEFEDAKTRAIKKNQPIDYYLEQKLEVLKTLFDKRFDAVDRYLASKRLDRNSLIRALEINWLSKDIAGPELRIRAAEALASLSKQTGETMDVIARRLRSKDPFRRIWAARAICEVEPKRTEELLRRLRNDPFVDQDGFYIVREAAGFFTDI